MADLIYTYNLNNTTFIRSSALFENGMATGAGDIRGVTYNLLKLFAVQLEICRQLCN